MGVLNKLPYTPPLEMVNVPPAMSSIEMVPSLAFLPRALIACVAKPDQPFPLLELATNSGQTIQKHSRDMYCYM